MTEEELQEKIDHAKRVADRAHEEWLDKLTSGDTGPKANRTEEIFREMWISSIRRYNALKSSYQRWRVNRTGHKRDE